jgi:hypothetical protein
MPRKNQAVVGEAVTYQIPAPAGGVQLETFIPWTLVKRGVKRDVITPLDAPGKFREEAAAERQARKASEDSALVRALGLAHYWQASGLRQGENAGRHCSIGSNERSAGTRDPAADPIGPGYHRRDPGHPATTASDVGVPAAPGHSAGLGKTAQARR